MPVLSLYSRGEYNNSSSKIGIPRKTGLSEFGNEQLCHSILLFNSRYKSYFRVISSNITIVGVAKKMSNESQEAANDDTAAVNAEEKKGEEPLAKKKRGASHQLTKDDCEDDGDEGSENNNEKLKQGFRRASDEVISKRKIYKISRTFHTTANATAPPATSTDKTATLVPASGKSNPFASINFSSSTESTKKVFGFGSASAFSSATSALSAGNGSSSFGNGSSGFEGGGGFAGVGTSGKSSGFGSSSGTESASGFVFGSKPSANGESGPSKSLFGNADESSNVKFSLSSSKSSDKNKNEVETTKLPDKVDLKTGEEDEEEIHSGRCKSFEWVVEEEEENNGGTDGITVDGNGVGDGKGSPTKTNPSVQSSTQFQATISSSMTNGDGDQKQKDNGSNSKKGATIEKSTADSSKSMAAPVEHRWMELGIGPVKILRSKSNPERLRLVQRRESSKMGPATKVILNIPLWKESSSERDRQALQYLRLTTIKDGKMCKYSLKFKENSEAGYFHHHLTDLIPLARKCFD